MDDVDINLFRFDWDQTMHMFFLNAQGHIYARYGVRKDGDGEKMNTLEGIRDAMRKVLEAHKKEGTKAPPAWKAVETQDLVSFKKDPRRPGGCLHCHHAGFYVRKEEWTAGKLTKDQIWSFPLPENIGITLDADRNTIVADVADPAAKAGIEAGDRIVSVDGQRAIAAGDVVWALNGFKGGSLKIVVEREGKTKTVTLTLKGDDWRKTDVSWRSSWWDSGPNIGLTGEDLTPEERKAAGLSESAIAIRVTKLKAGGNAQSAGIKADDIIVGVDGKSGDMEAMEFQMHVRLTRRVGDAIPITVQRGKQRFAYSVKLK